MKILDIKDPKTRELALTRYREEYKSVYGSEPGKCEESNIEIMDAFNWNQTPEGFDFWNNEWLKMSGKL